MVQEKKIKICALTTISKTMDWFIVDSMRNLAKNGYDVTLICNMEDGFAAANSDYAKCIHVPMERGASIKDVFKSVKNLKEIFKKEKFDILYYATPNASMYAALAGRSAKVQKRIYNQWGLRYISFTGAKRKLFKIVEKITCDNSTHVRAPSPMNREISIRERLCKENKISVIGVGGTVGVDLVECDSFDHEKTRDMLRGKYSIPTNAFVYGFVGRLNKDKGVNELIEAFSKIEEKKSDSYLVLVGMNDTANPITPENMQKAEMDSHIILTGNVPKDEVYEYMAMFDVLVHPTYREGFGKVLQEAMGMRLPIITTNIPGPSEVVAQGECGLLVDPKNVDDLVEKMILMESDAELRGKFASLGRIRAEKYFDRPIMLNNILRDINEIARE